MAIRGIREYNWSFEEIALNLHDSSRHIKPDEAIIVQDIDFDTASGGLAGRPGTKIINVTGADPGVPDPLAVNEFFDIFRATDVDTDKKYIIGIYDDGSNYKVAALSTTDGDKAFTTLAAAGGGAFNLTQGSRVSFANVREPGLNDVLVIGTNGIDSPFYFKGTGGITEFNFGDTSKFKLKYLLERPWKGRMWAALRAGEETTIHWSETDNFLSWVETEGSGFRQCPQDDLLNAFRGMRIFRDKLTVFNLDSIGEIFATGSAASPFRYRDLKRGHGAVHNNAIADDGDIIWFVDKRYPYLKFWDGYTVVDDYAGAETIAIGFEKWLDKSLAGLLSVRMTATAKKLYVTFLSSPSSTTYNTDGNRWLAVISLDKVDRNNLPYYPLSMWKIRANDIVVADEGTDIGQIYLASADTKTVSGTPYYFLKRIAGWFDIESAPLTAFGDNNGITGTDPDNVVNIMQTGWLSLPGNTWFELMFLSVDGEWEGTPSAGTTLGIKYRFDEESSFQTVTVASVDGVTRYPVAHNAQGRRMQLRFEYSDNQSRPILHELKIWYKSKAGIRN